MLRIGICDDSQNERFILNNALERLLEIRMIEHTIFEFSSGARFLKWLDKHAGELDLLFLDIEMPDINGMETAKHLRATGINLQIVFVTSHPDYVFDGYTVNAMGYLLKPADAIQLDELITRVLAVLYKEENEFYTIQNKEGTYRLPLKEILYFFSERRQVTCVTRSRHLSFYARLNDVEKQLPKSFVRIHQRYIVNAERVEHIRTDSILLGEKELPVSRSYREKALLSLTRAMLH